MSDHQFFDLDGTPRGRVYHWRVVDGAWRLVFGDKQTLVIRPLQHDKVEMPTTCPTSLESVLARLGDYMLACMQADGDKEKEAAIAGLRQVLAMATGKNGKAISKKRLEVLFLICREGMPSRAAWNHEQLTQYLEIMAWASDPATVIPASLRDGVKPAERQKAIAEQYMSAFMPSARAQTMRDGLFAKWQLPLWAQEFDAATRQQICFVARFGDAASTSTCPVIGYDLESWNAEDSRLITAMDAEARQQDSTRPPTQKERIVITDASGAVVLEAMEGYRSIKFYGDPYTFTLNQATAIQTVCEAYPYSVHETAISERVGETNSHKWTRRIRDIFLTTKEKEPFMHPAFKKVIVRDSERQGMWRLGIINPRKSPV